MLSFVLPAGLVPLVLLTRQRSVVGALVSHPLTSAAAGLATGVITVRAACLLLSTLG